jgi:hypothetical protein
MAKFTDTQLIVLSAAGARDDGIAAIRSVLGAARLSVPAHYRSDR